MSVEKTRDGQDQLDIPLQSCLGGKQKPVPWDLQSKSHLHSDINIKNRQKKPTKQNHSSVEPLSPWTETHPADVSLRNKTSWGVTPKDTTTTRLQWISPLQNAKTSTRKLNWGIHPMEWNVLPIPAFMPKQADLKPLSSDHKSTKILQLVWLWGNNFFGRTHSSWEGSSFPIS